MTFCYMAATTYGLCCDFLLYDNFVQKQRSSHAEVILFWGVCSVYVAKLWGHTIYILALSLAERIFAGRSHIEKVAEARLEQINRYCQVRFQNSSLLRRCGYLFLGIQCGCGWVSTLSWLGCTLIIISEDYCWANSSDPCSSIYTCVWFLCTFNIVHG